MTTIDYLSAINERAKVRREKYTYHLVRELPAQDKIFETAIVGTYSVTLLESMQRFVLRHKAIELESGHEAPSTITRDYIKAKYKRSPKASRKQLEVIRRGLVGNGIKHVNPSLVKPQSFSEGFYLDIKSTYLTIVNRVGWDLDYWPGRWLSLGRPCDDFPFQDSRDARNCLVSLCISSESPLYFPPNRLRPESDFILRNDIINLQLWRMVQDVLFGVAYDMRRAGAIYIHCDGYIAPDYKSLSNMIQVLDDWQLPYSIKHSGRGRVYGFGDYDFPSRLRHPKRKTPEASYRSNLYNISYHDWLKSRFASPAP